MASSKEDPLEADRMARTALDEEFYEYEQIINEYIEIFRSTLRDVPQESGGGASLFQKIRDLQTRVPAIKGTDKIMTQVKVDAIFELLKETSDWVDVNERLFDPDARLQSRRLSRRLSIIYEENQAASGGGASGIVRANPSKRRRPASKVCPLITTLHGETFHLDHPLIQDQCECGASF